MTWLDYHEVLLRHFLVNLGRAVALFLAVLIIFALMAADWQGKSLPFGGVFFLGLLESVMPLSLLVATLFTVGPRAHFKELTALTSAGFSMFQIMWPLFAVAAVAAAYSVVLQWAGVPMGGPQSSTPVQVQTAFHANLAYPAANFFGVAAGIILSSSPTRKSVYSGFLPAFFVVVAYSVVNTAAQVLGRHGFLPPVLAGWLGTVVAAGALWAMWRRAGL